MRTIPEVDILHPLFTIAPTCTSSLLDDFGQPNTSNVPRRELDNFHSHNLGFTDFRRNSSRGITGQNPGPSSGFNAPVASNPGTDTYYGATIPNNYYRNNN
ncbi:1749_t:CDS:2 [Racocetra fulgida]|uniref:1749_t:CDS:1 n=1 Tax=Racocetra fulgida TaxID=60492 RepID=A0A9N9BIG0_9GLOM|nr:1749_t:CDS:2 [Racocetra fulgida]